MKSLHTVKAFVSAKLKAFQDKPGVRGDWTKFVTDGKKQRDELKPDILAVAALAKKSDIDPAPILRVLYPRQDTIMERPANGMFGIRQHSVPVENPLSTFQDAMLVLETLSLTEHQPNTSVVFSGTEPTPDVKDLAFRLASRGDRPKIEIAREFAGERAESLLAQIARLERAGRITFANV